MKLRLFSVVVVALFFAAATGGQSTDLAGTAIHVTAGPVAGVSVSLGEDGEECGLPLPVVAAEVKVKTGGGVVAVSCQRAILCDCVEGRFWITMEGPIVSVPVLRLEAWSVR